MRILDPMLRLAHHAALRALPDDAKAALRLVLLDLRADAQRQADNSWKRHKGPMAAYWKAVAVYAGHFARLVRPAPKPVTLDLAAIELRAVAASMELFAGLTHVVQVQEQRNGATWWETLAAFNVESVANDYAQSCHSATRRSYRVMPTMLMPR